MEHLQLADGAAGAAASAHNAALIYVRGTEALCMMQAAAWLSVMQHQDAHDPLAGTIVGLQHGTGQLELLLVRSSNPSVDATGKLLLSHTQPPSLYSDHVAPLAESVPTSCPCAAFLQAYMLARAQ
jgi:hypothetical protein